MRWNKYSGYCKSTGKTLIIGKVEYECFPDGN